MIDIEADVFDYLFDAVTTAHPGTDVGDESEKIPATLPAVTVREANNAVHTRMRTSEAVENAAKLMYEIGIYSNSVSGKKAEAKAIAQTVDSAMTAIGFVRTMKEPVPNFADASIYRIVCRYEGVAVPNDDTNIYIHSN